MSNFNRIPIKDINYLVKKYNLSTENKYLAVWNFIISNNILVPESIANFIIDYNNLIYFDVLPDDILFNILNQLNYETIFEVCKLSKRLKLFCQNNLLRTLQVSLHNQTGFITDEFTLKQLYFLAENRKMQKRISSFNSTFVINDIGHVYIFKQSLILNLDLDIIKVSAGLNFAIFLTKNGEVYIKGRSKRLISLDAVTMYMGMNNVSISKIIGINNAIDIVAYDDTVLILLDNGTILGFGDNKYGYIPNINDKFVDVPRSIPNIKNIKYMEYTLSNLYLISNDNKIHEINYEDEDMEPVILEGQLQKIGNIIKIQDWATDVIILNSNGEVMIVKENEIIKIKVNIVDISSFNTANKYGILLLDKNGDVYIYGYIVREIYNSNKEIIEVSNDKHINVTIPTKLNKFKNIIYIYAESDILFLVDKDHNLYVNYIDDYGKYNKGYPSIRKHPNIKM